MKHQLSVTWQHMRRSPYQAVAAIMVMMLTMFVLMTFFIASLASRQLLQYLEQKPQVIAFFKDSITSEDQVSEIKTEIEATGKAAVIKFVSKEGALSIYKDRYKEDPLLLELVTANTLPASLEVSARNVSDLPQFYEILKKAPDLESVAYQKDIVVNLIDVLDKVRKFGVGLIVFLGMTALFTILTIVGMKIAVRKDEIEVERLVGASRLYIFWPFLLEGFFYGVIGTVVSWGFLYGLVLLLTPVLSPHFVGMGLFPVSPIFMILVLIGGIITGGLVGVVGSFLAVWRFLRD